MLLFDEFPLSSLLDSRGRIDRRLYPNFAALADQSTWYRNATGVAGFTPWALPSMLTGNYPDGALAPSYTEYPDNLFTLFGRYYDVTAYETISQLCPPRHCTPAAGDPKQSGLRGVVGDSARVLKQILQPYDAAFDPALFVDQTRPREELDPRPKDTAAADFRFKQAGRNQPARFDDFLHGLRSGDRPALHFLHLLLPHQPWRYLPSGNQYNFKTFGGAFRSDRLPAPVVELAHQQHLLQLAYTDSLVGQVIDKLKADGMWDKSLVVMGADHGEGWTPGEPSRALGQRNAPDLMWVPQFIKAPGQDNGTVDDRNWEQVDLLPTVADLAGVQVPWKMDGASQTGKPTRTRTEKWWFDVPGRREVRDGPANLCPGSRGHHRHPGPGLGGRARPLPVRPRRRPRLPRPGLGRPGRRRPGHRCPGRRPVVPRATPRVGNGPGPRLGPAHLRPAARRHRPGRRQRPDRRWVRALLRTPRGAGGRVRRAHPGLPVEAWRRPPPAPALHPRPERRSAAPPAGQRAGRVAADRREPEPPCPAWCMDWRDRVRGGPTTGRTGTRRAGTRG